VVAVGCGKGSVECLGGGSLHVGFRGLQRIPTAGWRIGCGP
jgi:hypothetical protein